MSLHSVTRLPSSCYTVHLSLGTPGEYRKTGADPLRYQGDLQIRQHTVTKPDFSEDKMTFSQILSRTKSVDNTGRLPPVLESDEQHEAVFSPVSAILRSIFLLSDRDWRLRSSCVAFCLFDPG